MSTLAQWCYRRRFVVLGAWITALVGLAVAALTGGTDFKTAAELPDSESSQSYALLAEADVSSDTTSSTIVWRTDGVAIDDPAVVADVGAMLDAVAAEPGVAAVISPYSEAGAAQVNAAESTAFATVALGPDADTDEIRSVAEQATSGDLDVALGGQAFVELPSPSGGTEGIGIIAALVILLLVFRSGWAAALPILTGVTGVATSLLLVMVASHVVDLDSTSLTMAALIGLGVGIDYALFIVNRYRNALMAGRSVGDAVAQAVTTSGRAVVFAGLTVIVALLGMFVVGLGVLTGMGQAAAVTVLFTVAAAVTLLPALLGMLGHKVLSRKQRAALAAGALETRTTARPTVSSRWARLLHKAPGGAAAVALVLLVALAAPAVTMRVGNADPSSDPAGSPGREYVDLMAPAFGEGVDAPLLLVARTPDAAAALAFADLTAALPDVAGVASVQAAPLAPGQTVAVAVVTPLTSAQAEETQDLVRDLRDDVIPAAEAGTRLEVLVGGETATNIDISDALMSRLPLYLGLIAVLGFLLLAVAFRSVLVPLVGAVTNLATIVVGLGVITLIFQHGYGSELLGVGSGAPVMYIVPIIIVGVMFGLSMDYQVFLVSRMHEEWSRGGTNGRAVRVGVAETGRVIATAATIMLSVFASFGFSGERIVSAIGIGMAIAVMVDAFVVRLTLVPALMNLIGSRNWAYPRWADRITPHVSVEGPAETADDRPASRAETKELVGAGYGTR
ncbi:MMPL family transporter [Antribacter sp. KLBMP9083]|uniref:MMPL family transporter n=1 Tax=Antribacter soli TaxID=2910976 RepID=A0AA41U7B5_9MICO|nr:MMPL family transporter [Antribacter soli]MCF4121381.1 MMPL family transporter [Antribacter soli]